MRRQTGLKVVPREESSGSGGTVLAPERESGRTGLSIERNFLDTLDTMERFMHNSLTRMLGGIAPVHGARLFDRFGGLTGVNPAVDIYEEGEELVVKAELPGIGKNDVNIRLLDNSLVISGEKKSERSEETKGYYRIERSAGSFERTILLPEGVKTEKAKASFTNGVLQIRIPKGTEKSLGRKIAIE
jgi:HSP20 family protein